MTAWEDRHVDPVLRPIRSGNAFEETVERLLHAVQLGVVQPGQRLPPERELATRLRVSRETLRDAIRALRDAGYLDSRPGRGGGTFVLEPPHRLPATPLTHRRRGRQAGSAVEDALRLRYAVETGAAELAARRQLDARSRGWLAGLHAECCSVGSVAQPPAAATYRPADSRLHLAIAELSGSPSLAAAVADVRARVNDLLGQIPLLPRNIDHSNRQHGRIVDAILAGAPEPARTAMAEHLEGTAALLRGFLT